MLNIKLIPLLLLGSALSYSAVILDTGFVSLQASDSFQLGRLSRNGVPADWATIEPFPGVLNTSTQYQYRMLAVPITDFPYLQITIDNPSASIFASAYLNNYNPANKSANYLGDAGSSGNFAGNPEFFQVVLPYVTLNHADILVNSVGASTNGPFRVIVEGFYTTDYNDTTPPVPEPASVALTGSGLVVAALFFKRWRLLSAAE